MTPKGKELPHVVATPCPSAGFLAGSIFRYRPCTSVQLDEGHQKFVSACLVSILNLPSSKTNTATENGPVGIVSFPIVNMVKFRLEKPIISVFCSRLPEANRKDPVEKLWGSLRHRGPTSQAPDRPSCPPWCRSTAGPSSCSPHHWRQHVHNHLRIQSTGGTGNLNSNLWWNRLTWLENGHL